MFTVGSLVLCPGHHWPLCVVCGACYHAGVSVLSHLFCVLSLTVTTRCWELPETEPQPSSVLANLWQWALLGTRSELGLATSGPCWAERHLRPGEAHTWGGRLAGSERRGGPAPKGTDATVSGSALFHGEEMLDRPPGERVQPGQQGMGTRNPGHRRSTEDTQTPEDMGRRSEKTACPHGGR